MRRAALIVVALVACGSPRSVDSVIAAHHHDRTIAAPADRAPMPWRVGQWTLHKVVVKGELSYVRHSLVAQDRCGIWLETVEQTRRGRSVVKVCFRSVPDPTQDDATQLDLVEAVMSRRGDGRVVEADFRNGQNPNTKGMLKAILQAFSTLAWHSAPASEPAAVAVPAGRFEGAAKLISRVYIMESLHTIQTWLHPAVPIGGAIKTVSTDGVESELLDFGYTGATSELRDFDDQQRESGLAP